MGGLGWEDWDGGSRQVEKVTRINYFHVHRLFVSFLSLLWICS